MLREEVAISTRTLQWKCVESRIDSKLFYYARFVLSPLMKGQANTIGIAIRRSFLGEGFMVGPIGINLYPFLFMKYNDYIVCAVVG